MYKRKNKKYCFKCRYMCLCTPMKIDFLFCELMMGGSYFIWKYNFELLSISSICICQEFFIVFIKLIHKWIILLKTWKFKKLFNCFKSVRMLAFRIVTTVAVDSSLAFKFSSRKKINRAKKVGSQESCTMNLWPRSGHKKSLLNIYVSSRESTDYSIENSLKKWDYKHSRLNP